MHPLRSLGFFVVLVFVGGALLAPWVYWCGASILPGTVTPAQFVRVVHRCMLGLALLSLWPLLRQMKMSWGADLGLINPKGQFRRILTGFGLGFISLAIVAVLAVFVGARSIEQRLQFQDTLAFLAAAVGTAVVVSFIEEILFRGAIFGSLRRAHGWKAALLYSSLVYAILHFFARPLPPSSIVWHSGFSTLGGMLTGFIDLSRLVPSFFTLTLVGMVLALAYQRTGNLCFSFGLHAGWIFWLKSYNKLTSAGPPSLRPIWGGNQLIDGWAATAVVGLILLCVWMLPSVTRTTSNEANLRNAELTENLA